MKKNRVGIVILIVIFLVGLSLLLYPTISDYWNSLHQSRAIGSYIEDAAALEDDTYEQILADARSYNQALAGRAAHYELTAEEQEEYERMLNISESGVIGYIEIVKIDCRLPIYHGTDESVLQRGVGHLEGTSLPVGGESTHCVISGHRGLPSTNLFTDLDKLEAGDTFCLYVLDEVLTYEVDQIRIVEPQETEELKIVEGKDYCTLVTCTPYGINTHRLLVRGHRVENAAGTDSSRVTADAMQIEPTIVAPLLAVPILLVLLVGWGIKTRGRRKGKT